MLHAKNSQQNLTRNSVGFFLTWVRIISSFSKHTFKINTRKIEEPCFPHPWNPTFWIFFSLILIHIGREFFRLSSSTHLTFIKTAHFSSAKAHVAPAKLQSWAGEYHLDPTKPSVLGPLREKVTSCINVPAAPWSLSILQHFWDSQDS